MRLVPTVSDVRGSVTEDTERKKKMPCHGGRRCCFCAQLCLTEGADSAEELPNNVAGKPCHCWDSFVFYSIAQRVVNFPKRKSPLLSWVRQEIL